MSAAPKTPPPTYSIAGDRRSILCLRCGRRSHNENDVRHIYCGACGYHTITRDDNEHGDPRMLVAALTRRALFKANGNKRHIPPEVIEYLENAITKLDAELAFEALRGLAGDS